MKQLISYDFIRIGSQLVRETLKMRASNGGYRRLKDLIIPNCTVFLFSWDKEVSPQQTNSHQGTYLDMKQPISYHFIRIESQLVWETLKTSASNGRSQTLKDLIIPDCTVFMFLWEKQVSAEQTNRYQFTDLDMKQPISYHFIGIGSHLVWERRKMWASNGHSQRLKDWLIPNYTVFLFLWEIQVSGEQTNSYQGQELDMKQPISYHFIRILSELARQTLQLSHSNGRFEGLKDWIIPKCTLFLLLWEKHVSGEETKRYQAPDLDVKQPISYHFIRILSQLVWETLKMRASNGCFQRLKDLIMPNCTDFLFLWEKQISWE
jgi:hypothetical protein